ncbi:MAG: hypothetical protein ABI359_10775 [Ginsengibacter sp.]
MKFIKVCVVVLLMGAAFSACETQGEVINIVHGTPSNADTVLPRKFGPNHHADSTKALGEENVPTVFRR